ncbi:hypothetical protein F01_400122 [Burkholderia cenocepacia]|nr:hypothetical protein F01_400122 [Burkholderia cenocepacia]
MPGARIWQRSYSVKSADRHRSAAAPTDRHKAFTRARMTAKKRPLASGAAGKERSLGGIPVDTTPNRSAYC